MTEEDKQVTYAYLETTNACNLDCRYCNRRDVVKQSKHMTLDDWNKVLDKLSSQPINEAKLMGLGEPFFHPHFDEICRRFKAVFPSAFTISATNCQYKLGKNFVSALPFIDLLYLSVDGYMKTYEQNRDGAKWSKLIDFLEDLSNIDTGRTRITINYVVNNDNFKDIEKINRLVSKKYSFIEEVRLNISQWWSEDEEVKIGMDEELYSTLIKYKQNVKGKAPWTFSDCFWPVRGFYMDVNGDVKICCLNTSTEPVGNIFRSPIHDILNAPKRRQVAEECKRNTPGIHCRKCDYKRLSPILAKVFS